MPPPRILDPSLLIITLPPNIIIITIVLGPKLSSDDGFEKCTYPMHEMEIDLMVYLEDGRHV